MSNSRNWFSSIRLYLIVAIVFFVSLIFTGYVGGPVIAILTYLVIQYRRRVKDLEQRLGSVVAPASSGPQDIPPPPEAPVPPMSTDA